VHSLPDRLSLMEVVIGRCAGKSLLIDQLLEEANKEERSSINHTNSGDKKEEKGL
jgi:hypothetical protein